MAEEKSIPDLVNAMLEQLQNENVLVNNLAVVEFDPASPPVLLLMCKWYGKEMEVARLLLSLYSASVELEESSDSVDTLSAATHSRKKSVARTFRYWLSHFPEDFRDASDLLSEVSALQDSMRETNDLDLLDMLSMDSLVNEPEWMPNPLPLGGKTPRRPSLGFEATPPTDLAEIMCCIDSQFFRKIPIREFSVYAHAAKPTTETPFIEDCIQLFNGLTVWVVCNILKGVTIIKRADTIEKFIDCTRHLLKLRCYNALLAVVGGLNHFSIRRLSQTWAKVEKSKLSDLEAMNQFFSSHSNYSTYRKAIDSRDKDFHVPVLGIVLKDLVAIDAQSKDFVSSDNLNMNKYRMLYTTLSSIKSAQSHAPSLTVDTYHMRVLRVAINERNMSDNALEELSLAREPRMGMAKEKSLEAGEANLPKFSEWAAGRQSSLDTDTLSQHVTQMVDAVFRAYDTDNSGSISIEEFDAISSNFPFIECFSVLDQDNDGMISYDELLSYFESANSQLREKFTHLFAEHTFIGTPVCEHCKGMMKGIVRQGVRCKDCGISCHKHCKDHVVVDCTKRKEKKKAKARDTRSSSMTIGGQTSDLYCDDDISLKERLARAEAARDALSAENSELLAKLAEANAKIHQLQSHIAVIRQHTIGFILEQMNTLSPAGADPGTEV